MTDPRRPPAVLATPPPDLGLYTSASAATITSMKRKAAEPLSSSGYGGGSPDPQESQEEHSQSTILSGSVPDVGDLQANPNSALSFPHISDYMAVQTKVQWSPAESDTFATNWSSLPFATPLSPIAAGVSLTSGTATATIDKDTMIPPKFCAAQEFSLMIALDTIQDSRLNLREPEWMKRLKWRLRMRQFLCDSQQLAVITGSVPRGELWLKVLQLWSGAFTQQVSASDPALSVSSPSSPNSSSLSPENKKKNALRLFQWEYQDLNLLLGQFESTLHGWLLVVPSGTFPPWILSPSMLATVLDMAVSLLDALDVAALQPLPADAPAAQQLQSLLTRAQASILYHICQVLHARCMLQSLSGIAAITEGHRQRLERGLQLLLQRWMHGADLAVEPVHPLLQLAPLLLCSLPAAFPLNTWAESFYPPVSAAEPMAMGKLERRESSWRHLRVLLDFFWQLPVTRREKGESSLQKELIVVILTALNFSHPYQHILRDIRVKIEELVAAMYQYQHPSTSLQRRSVQSGNGGGEEPSGLEVLQAWSSILRIALLGRALDSTVTSEFLAECRSFQAMLLEIEKLYFNSLEHPLPATFQTALQREKDVWWVMLDYWLHLPE